MLKKQNQDCASRKVTTENEHQKSHIYDQATTHWMESLVLEQVLSTHTPTLELESSFHDKKLLLLPSVWEPCYNAHDQSGGSTQTFDACDAIGWTLVPLLIVLINKQMY